MPAPNTGLAPPATILAALWYGALLFAVGQQQEPWPPDLDELAERYFAVFRSEVQA